MKASRTRALAATLAASCVLAPSVAVRAQETPADSAGRADTARTITDGVDYRIYDRWGNPTSLLAIVGSSVGDDVLLIGEEHDDMVGHALEVELLEAVLEEIGASESSGRSVVLSLEMFERDVQYVLDEYLDGLISEQHFLASARPWDHYESRYRPLVELAKERGTPVVAANAPRRYVSRVTSDGPRSLADLSEQALRYLPPIPYPGPSDVYRRQWDALMEAATEGQAESARAYAANPNVIYSQALWDAAMGHAITEALVRHLDGFVVHVAGSFHVEKGTGIPERITDYRPGTRVTTVVLTKAEDIDAWSAEEHAPLADFVVLTKAPEDAAGG